jgi:hypothetical protein
MTGKTRTNSSTLGYNTFPDQSIQLDESETHLKVVYDYNQEILHMSQNDIQPRFSNIKDRSIYKKFSTALLRRFKLRRKNRHDKLEKELKLINSLGAISDKNLGRKIREIAEEEDISRIEVLRRAVALYSQCLKHAKKGRLIQFVEESETIKEPGLAH